MSNATDLWVLFETKQGTNRQHLCILYPAWLQATETLLADSGSIPHLIVLLHSLSKKAELCSQTLLQSRYLTGLFTQALSHKANKSHTPLTTKSLNASDRSSPTRQVHWPPLQPLRLWRFPSWPAAQAWGLLLYSCSTSSSHMVQISGLNSALSAFNHSQPQSSLSCSALPFSVLFICFLSISEYLPFRFAPALAFILQTLIGNEGSFFSGLPFQQIQSSSEISTPNCSCDLCTTRLRVLGQTGAGLRKGSERVTDHWNNKKRVSERLRRVWDKCGQMGSVWISRRLSCSRVSRVKKSCFEQINDPTLLVV